MTVQDSDAKLRRIVCPECFEEMAREELIGTKCPLCGYSLAKDELEDDFSAVDGDEELSWMLTQNLQRSILDWLMEYGASPLTAYHISYKVCCMEITPVKKSKYTKFSFSARMNYEEKSADKICKNCGKSFVHDGRKVVSGDLFEPEPDVSFYCSDCDFE